MDQHQPARAGSASDLPCLGGAGVSQRVRRCLVDQDVSALRQVYHRVARLGIARVGQHLAAALVFYPHAHGGHQVLDWGSCDPKLVVLQHWRAHFFGHGVAGHRVKPWPFILPEQVHHGLESLHHVLEAVYGQRIGAPQ